MASLPNLFYSDYYTLPDSYRASTMDNSRHAAAFQRLQKPHPPPWWDAQGVEGARKKLMAPEPVSGRQECLLHTCRTGAIRMTSLPLFLPLRSGFAAVNTPPDTHPNTGHNAHRLPALTGRRRWYPRTTTPQV